MNGQTSFAGPRTLGQRLAWAVAALALVLTLALGGCRAGAHSANQGNQTTQQQSGATPGGTTSAGGATAGSNSAALQQLQTIDNQNQSDSQQLNSAQSSASVNYASQDTETLP